MTFFIIFICLIVKEGAELENRKMVLLLGAGAAPGGAQRREFKCKI
jgi:hypothetical protein